MAPRYGGHEDLERERALLRQLEGGLDNLTAKEKAARTEAETTSRSLERQVSRRERLTQIQREQRQVQERAAAAQNVEARALDQTTEAIARNAAARERAAVAAVNQERAFRGARDPLFGRATALGQEGLPPSQYQMRRELRIGQQRAQRLQEAMQAGYAPARPAAHDQPLAPARAVVQADIEKAAATKAYNAAVRRGDIAAAESAQAARAKAAADKQAATAALESARSDTAAATSAKAEAAQREKNMVERAAGGSGALVPRTPAAGAVGGRMFGESGPFYGAFPKPGRNFMEEQQPPTARAREVEAQATLRQAAAHQTLLQSLSEEDREVHTRTYTAAAEARARMAQTEGSLARATHFSAVELGTANQQMRQHGTLTSEFIQAAMRGETTLREVGNQALVTAGKFGAWTVAATAIYGAVAAVHQVGQGAIDASSGVNQLQRVVRNVNGDQLKGQFSDLANEFNVPVGIATDAVYRMGQVFHTQAEAVEASKAALYSYKTGEVDVATSTQSLIAIVNGFGLSSSQLVDVYDQINQAQNTFGVRIGDTEAGLAKAAGTFRNAGGDLNYLLALFVAIQKATGRSGQEIGTGIARGVNQIRQPANQAKLRAQGVAVDPENFQKTLQSAFEAARRPGADLQAIATGLLGNQYARLIAPVLRNQTLLNRAIADTSPEASKNSAQRELATVLKSVDEQISHIGVNLQRLGVALGRAGAGDFAYLMLRGLNLVLGTAVRLVEVFDLLPSPLRHALTLMAQMALVVATLRRFGGLPGIASRTGLTFLASPENALRARVTRGARDTVEAADRSRERAAQALYNARSTAQVEAERAAEHNAMYAQRQAAGTLPAEGSKARLALEDENRRLNQRANAAQDAANVAQDEANTKRRLALRATEEQTRISKMTAAEIEADVAAGRRAYPGSFNVPERGGAQTGVPPRQALERDAAALAAARVPARGTTLAEDIARATGAAAPITAQAEATRTASRELNRVERAILPYTAGLRSLGSNVRGISGRPLGAAARASAGLLDRGAAAVNVTGRTLSGVGAGLSRLVGALGPLDIAILGFIGLTQLFSYTEKLTADQNRLLAQLEAAPSSAEGVKAQGEQITAALARGDRLNAAPTSTGELLRGFVGQRNGGLAPGAQARASLRASAQGLSDTLHLRVFGANYESPWQREARIRQEAENARAERERITRLQQAQRAAGKPIPLQSVDQVRHAMDRDAKLRAQGVISFKEFDRRMHDHAIELTTALNPTQDALTAARQAAAQAKRNAAPDLFHRYQGAGADEVRNRLALLQTKIGTGDASDKTIQEAGYAYRRLVEQNAGVTDPKTLLQFFQDRDAYFKSLEEGAQNELTNALAGARTEGQRHAAFEQARARYRQIPQADRTQLAADARRTTETATRLAAERRGLGLLRGGLLTSEGGDNTLGFLADHLPGRAGELAAQGKSAIEKLKSNAKADREQLAKLKKQVGEDSKRYKDALRRQHRDDAAIAQQEFQDRDQGRDITLALRQSRTRDPLAQASLAVDSARRSLADARKNGSSRDRMAAETKLNQAEQARDQATLQRAQAMDQVREAQVSLRTGNDPVAVARAALASARNTLAILRRQHADPAAIAQALAGVYQAEAQLAQSAHDDAQQLAQLRFQLAAARAGGTPEAEAKAAQQTAHYDLAHARNAKERLQALLDLANANNQSEQAAADAEAARYELLASLTTDPVEQAGYRVQGDRAALRHAHGTTGRRRALAQLNNDRQALRDARLQSSEDDIEFNLDMERISREQAVSQYQQLLQAHNLTKTQRREIMRRIHALQKEADQDASGFGLQVGQGVKLPTIYDVRRAISGARHAADQGTTIHARTQTVVNVEVNDPDAAGAVFDAIDGALNTSTRSTMRSAGLTV